MPTRYLLAIDQGTTGSRALLYNQRGTVVAQAYQEFRQHFPHAGWVEHDANEILSSVRTVIARALNQKRISGKSIDAIGVTNQRETVVFWDRKTGRPVGRAIVWQDRRTHDLCQQLKHQGHEPFVRKRTGLFFDPYFSGSKLRWFFDQNKSLKRRAQRGELCVGTIDSWLLFHLTGKKVHATDFTNASRTLLFNIKKRAWDSQLLRLFHVPKLTLPKAKPSNSIFGLTKGFSPLADGIPISGILGDQQSALYGQGCYSPGTSKNTYGTGCFLLVNLGRRFKLSRSGLVTTIACDEKGNPVYAIEASIFIAGAAIQWLRDGLRLIKEASETERIARATKEVGGLVVIPAFTGLGAPHWRSDVRGAILGITRGTTREMLIKATLDSVALQVQQVFDLIRRESGVKIPELKVDGGASQNRYLMQLQADLLKVPILKSSVVEATAWGVAKLAGRVTHFWKPLKAVEGQVSYTRIRPKMSPSLRKTLVDRWEQAVHQLTA